MGWALDNLGSADCRRIAEGLFDVDAVYKGDRLHGYCPVHGDKKSASFVYNFEEDWCKCQSCGFGGDLVKLWCELTRHDHQDLKAFKDEFGEGVDTYPRKTPRKTLTRTPKKPPADVFIDESVLQSLPPLPEERIKQLEQDRGWTAEAISRMDLREFLAGGKYAKIAFPIRDEEGRLCNIRLYQPGAAKLKMISWYDEKCHLCGSTWTKKNKQKVCSGCGSLPLDYGRTRLYPPPSQWKRGMIWLIEGESDLLCALSHGLNAVTQTAGAGTWENNADDFNPHFSGCDVVIAYDADQAGYKGAMKAAKSLANAGTASVRVISWPEWMVEASS